MLISVHLCFACIYVCVRTLYPLELNLHFGLPCGYLEQNSDLLEEQPVPLTTELSHQLQRQNFVVQPRLTCNLHIVHQPPECWDNYRYAHHVYQILCSELNICIKALSLSFTFLFVTKLSQKKIIKHRLEVFLNACNRK